MPLPPCGGATFFSSRQCRGGDKLGSAQPVLLQDFTISLMSASTETWLLDLDFLCRIPADLLKEYKKRMDQDDISVEISDIAIRQVAMFVRSRIVDPDPYSEAFWIWIRLPNTDPDPVNIG